MKLIDMHTHSNYSDGSFPPSEVFSSAAEAGLSAFALTDHDTVDGFIPLSEAAAKYNAGLPESRQIEVLPGVEISAAYKKGDIHILGLLVDPYSDNFNSLLKNAERERVSRNIKMVENLKNAGLPISYNEITAASPDAIITRAHFGKFLVEKGIVTSYAEAFEKYLGDTTPYYVARNFTKPEDAIHGILKAGGVPVLAHPFVYKLPVSELESLVDTLIDYGLRGIEAIYSNHSEYEELYLKQLAAKKGLLISGGSDFHGAPKPAIKIGSGRGNLKIPYEILENLKSEQKKIKTMFA